MTIAAFLGDSVTSGIAPGSPYPTPMCARMGWTGVNLGVAGTGYVAGPGIGQLTFRQRLAAVAAATPDVVIVEGGANDVPENLVSLASLTAELPLFFNALAVAVPSALVYAVMPWNVRIYSATDRNNVALAIQAECNSRGIPVLDWRPWVSGTGYQGHPIGDGNADVYYHTDNIHPSTAGNAYLGTRLAFAIRPPSTGLEY